MPTSQEDIDTIKDLLDGNTDTEVEDTTVDEAVEVETDAEEVDTEEVDTEEESEEEVDPNEGVDEDSDEYIFPTNIADLAKEIEVDPKDLYNVEIAMADGEAPVKIGELKNQFQEAKRNTARLEQQITQLQQTAQPQPNLSNDRIKLLGQQSEIQRQYKETDWATMEAQNPGEAALLKQKFQEANNITVNGLNQLQQDEKAQYKQNLVQSAQNTLELIPEWRDVDTRTLETQAIHQTLINEGVTEEAISAINDPLTIKLLRELMYYRVSDNEAQKTIKKVAKKAPKSIRSKGRVKASKNKKQENLINKAKKTHDKNDTLAAAKNILFG